MSATAWPSPPVRAYGHNSAVTWRTRVFNGPPSLRWWLAGAYFSGSSGNVILRDVRLEHPARGEALDRLGHCAFHHMYPLRGVLARDAVVVQGHHLVFEELEEVLRVLLLGFAFPCWQWNRPAVLARVALRPPAVQRAELGDAVQCRLHAARAAGLERDAGQVDPEVDPGHHALPHMQLVILEKGDAALEAGILRSHEDALQHALARIVRRMRLAGKDDLYGIPRIGQEPPQAFRIAEEQIGAFVRRKAPRKAERENVGGEERTGSCQFRRVLPVVPPTMTSLLADVVKQQMARALVHAPQPGII